MSDTKELEVKARSLGAEAQAIAIIDEAAYRAADAFGAAGKALLAEIDASYDPIISAAHNAHKAACDAKKTQAAPVESAMEIVKLKMITYYKAEQARLAEVRRAKEAEARQRAEEEALHAAAMLSAVGLHEAADAALESPIVEVVKVEEAPKIEGVSYRETWRARVVNLDALIQAAAIRPDLLPYLEANMTTLNGAARTYKNTYKIPGVVFGPETTMARR